MTRSRMCSTAPSCCSKAASSSGTDRAPEERDAARSAAKVAYRGVRFFRLRATLGGTPNRTAGVAR